MMNYDLQHAVSEANKVLPALLAAAQGHELCAAKQFEPCPFDVPGARAALYFVDRVMPHAQNQTHTLNRVRALLTAALTAAKADATPHHPAARRHALEELCARSSRAIRTRIDTLHVSAPPQYEKRVVAGVMQTCSAHEAFDDARLDATYLREWAFHLCNEERKRGHGDAAWSTMAIQLAAA